MVKIVPDWAKSTYTVATTNLGRAWNSRAARVVDTMLTTAGVTTSALTTAALLTATLKASQVACSSYFASISNYIEPSAIIDGLTTAVDHIAPGTSRTVKLGIATGLFTVVTYKAARSAMHTPVQQTRPRASSQERAKQE